MRLTVALWLFVVMGLSWVRAGMYLVDPQAESYAPLLYTLGGIAAMLVGGDQLSRFTEGR